MAKPTRLRVIGERAVPSDVEDGSPLAEAIAAHNAALVGQQAISGSPATPAATSSEQGARIIAYLQEQVAERDRVLQQQQSRIETVERTAATVAEQAEERITRAYEEATQAVRSSDAKRVAAEQQAAKVEQYAQQKASFLATVALGTTRQILDRIAWVIAFLTGKLPALAALYGGFLLWQSSLSQLNPLVLFALGLYGALIVLPTVWLAVRTEKPPPADPV